ncbi:MAG: helix-turn-helix transcriptional regulator [Clostridia bacterium]|nr:helix-turn-helix transcriptional regulator [Clostridia bacterium]
MSCNEYTLKYLKINRYEYDTDYTRTIDIPRPFNIITQITDGEVAFSDSYGNVVTAQKGDVVYIPMGCAYKMSWKGPSPSNIAVHYQFMHESGSYPMQKIEDVCYPFYELPEDELMMMSMFYHLYSICEPSLKKSKAPVYDNRIECAVDFIRTNYNVDFTIEQLSDMCHLSPSRFHYLFKKSVGHTAIDYKNKIKTDIAMQMLISTSMSVEEISDKLNFNSSIYFRRVFKKFTGMSATKYRADYLKQEI